MLFIILSSGCIAAWHMPRRPHVVDQVGIAPARLCSALTRGVDLQRTERMRPAGDDLRFHGGRLTGSTGLCGICRPGTPTQQAECAGIGIQFDLAAHRHDELSRGGGDHRAAVGRDVQRQEVVVRLCSSVSEPYPRRLAVVHSRDDPGDLVQRAINLSVLNMPIDAVRGLRHILKEQDLAAEIRQVSRTRQSRQHSEITPHQLAARLPPAMGRYGSARPPIRRRPRFVPVRDQFAIEQHALETIDIEAVPAARSDRPWKVTSPVFAWMALASGDVEYPSNTLICGDQGVVSSGSSRAAPEPPRVQMIALTVLSENIAFRAPARSASVPADSHDARRNGCVLT